MCPFPLIDRGGPGESSVDSSRLTDPDPTVERGLWLLVLVVSVLDIVTTSYGLSVGLVERNPLVRPALAEFGPAAFVVLKANAIAVGLVCRRLWPVCAVLAPLALAVTWLLAVGINLAVILSA